MLLFRCKYGVYIVCKDALKKVDSYAKFHALPGMGLSRTADESTLLFVKRSSSQNGTVKLRVQNSPKNRRSSPQNPIFRPRNRTFSRTPKTPSCRTHSKLCVASRHTPADHHRDSERLICTSPSSPDTSVLLLSLMTTLNLENLPSEEDRNFIPFPSRRSVVHSTKGIISSTQPLANEAGYKILAKGGNAADAAVAVAAALNVTGMFPRERID